MSLPTGDGGSNEVITNASNKSPWWKNVAGIFADEPMFDSVMRTIGENREREREEASRLADEAEARKFE